MIGGKRVLNTKFGRTAHGSFTNRPKSLTNDFFVNLLDMSVSRKKTIEDGIYEEVDRNTGRQRWTGTRVDLIFGSNSELRALAEVYGCNDAEESFLTDFIAAWKNVMNLDRFDLD